MEQLKCQSCGAHLKVDENKEFATCPYCNAKYKLKRDEDLNFKLEIDEETKENLKKGGRLVLKVYIINSIIGILITGAIIFGVFKVFSIIVKEANNQISENIKDEIDSFNSSYEDYNGSQEKFDIDDMLDEIAANNSKPNSKIISVKYNEYETSEPEKIIKLKKTLEDKQYEIMLDYDKKGYVDKVILTD